MKARAIFESLQRIAAFEERVLVAFEQRHVRVHARALHAFERLRHERRVDTLRCGRLTHHEPERHHVVGHRQRVGVAQVDLVLARAVLVERVLDRDAHRLERLHRALAQVAGDVGSGEVEVRAVVEHLQRLRGVALGEVEELHLGRHVEREAPLAGPVEVALEHLAGVALERASRRGWRCRRTSGRPGRRGIDPRQQLEAVGIGPGQHVALLHPGEPVDRRSVEGHALGEGVLELGGGDGERLELAEDVGEPEPDEADTTLLHRPQHVVLLALHADSFPCRTTRNRTRWPSS